MKDVSDWSVPKRPFLLGNALLLITAGVIVQKAAHPLSNLQIILVTACVALGALLGIWPFLLEFRAAAKLVELNTLTGVAEELKNLEKYAAQVSTATDQITRLQEAGQNSAKQTTTAALEIADRMTAEVRHFNEFQVKLNDHEKQMLRLEVDKLRRVEGDWLQASARILDHIYALYIAAVRSGQPEIAAQIGQFQNACREATRRVGLAAFAGEAGEPFDAQRHRAHGFEQPPAEGVIAETLALGIQFQGRLIRPALVRLQAPAEAVAEPAAEALPEPAAEPQAEPNEEPAQAAPPTPAAPEQASVPTVVKDLFDAA